MVGLLAKQTTFRVTLGRGRNLIIHDIFVSIFNCSYIGGKGGLFPVPWLTGSRRFVIRAGKF